MGGTPITTPITISLAVDDPQRVALEGQDYALIASGSTYGPDGAVYSAYLFEYLVDVAKPNLIPPLGSCQLVFYRWDGKINTPIQWVYGAEYPPTGPYANSWPVFCNAQHVMNQAEWVKTLGVYSSWSDINGNGLPEFEVIYWYCLNFCGGYPEWTTHYYELRSATQFVDITADLPGLLSEWPPHSRQPLTFYVYDPEHVYSPHNWIDVPWIYQWDGRKFVDVTSRYTQEYVDEAQKLAAAWRTQYGQPFPWKSEDDEMRLLRIPLLYEKAGLREVGVSVMQELTDPKHWPGTNAALACWLQFVRKRFQSDYEANKPFSLPFNYLIMGGDASACK